MLAGEEHPARKLVEFGVSAEEAGLAFLFLSDHFHPWNLQQGHSSYTWSVLGALATRTERVGLFSAVTCPILRIHPTNLAQAASTVYHLSDGRFCLGLGTGEALNEKVVGKGFPPFAERLARLEEALMRTRELLTGTEVSSQGEFFSLQRAQLFDAATDLKIYLASSGERSARLAGRLADGLICLGSRPELLSAFQEAGGTGPAVAQLSVCWAASREEAARTAHRFFPEVCLEGTLFAELSTPADFSRATEDVKLQDVAASIVCGPDPQPYLELIRECLEAGYRAVALHQIGPDQDGFLNFWRSQLLPRLNNA